MNAIYFTIAGTNHWHGSDFLKEDMRVKLVKEPEGYVTMITRGRWKVSDEAIHLIEVT